MTMLKQHKKPLLITSVLTLLPIFVGLLLWNRFPEIVATHYSLSGQPDGWSSLSFAVLIPPVLMLALHWLCVLLTIRDPGNQQRNQKMFQLVLWIIPITSNLCCYSMYALALGKEFNIISWTMVGMGILFAAMGNYLPKTKMNNTMGIKVSWAYTSEDNWNATHRFAGKLWVAGGIAMLFLALLPEAIAILGLFFLAAFLCVAPMVYSWRYWKQQLARGDELKPRNAAHPAMTKGTIVFLILLLLFAISVLFYGSVEFDFREDGLYIDANCYSDYYIPYSEIQSVTFRASNVDGIRVGGYGNLRVGLGYFKNDEFGTYIRYAYTAPDACVVVTLPEQTVVLSGKTAEETRGLWEQLTATVS